MLHPQFAGTGKVIAKGLAASPGAAVGKVYFTADDAEAAAERGEKVILVRSETSPEDVHGMMASRASSPLAAVSSATPPSSPAAGAPRPSSAPSRSRSPAKPFTANGVTVNEGDVISIDGSSGEVVLGRWRSPSAEPPAEFDTILAWADAVRKGKLGVRANADTGEDATNARRLGAEGIGLCRTEHMFLAPDRLPVVRRMILASTDEEERPRRSTSCARSSRTTSPRSSRRWTGCRSRCACSIRRCTSSCRRSRSCDQAGHRRARRRGEAAARRAESWSEHNPMLGTRGVRLGVVKPGSTACRCGRCSRRRPTCGKQGKNPIVEIMIPLTVTREELHLARGWVEEEIDRHEGHAEEARTSRSAR